MRAMVALVAALGLLACQGGSPAKPRITPPDDHGADGKPKSGAWFALAPASNAPAARTGHTAVWTGSQMLVFGGADATGAPLNDGGALTPNPISWLPLSQGNAPAPRQRHTAVWTDSGMVVWGGELLDRGTGALFPTNSGGIYSAEWELMRDDGAPTARFGHTAVSTGAKMIVWGGTDGSVNLNTGGIFDPLSNTWQTALPTSGAPTARNGHTAVWTGSDMIIWGGASTQLENTGAVYHAANNTWSPVNSVGAPSARTGHTAVWAGNKMVIFGGRGLVNGKVVYFNDGGVYDPASDSWSDLATEGAPSARTGHTAVAGGNVMFVYGGYNDQIIGDAGGFYLVEKNAWQPLPNRSGDIARSGNTAVWAEDKMIVWGGYSWTKQILDTGGIYYPPEQ